MPRWPDLYMGAPRTLNVSILMEIQKYFSQTSAGACQTNVGEAALGVSRIVYCPFELERVSRFTTAWVFNGVGGGSNWDIGVYNEDGTRLWSSGSTAYSANSVPQTFTISGGLTLGRGAYYLAIVTQSNNHCYGFSGALTQDFFPCGPLQQASTFPLPATATFAAMTTAFVPMIGITGRLF